jgi:DNA (cytosine-5)-methyltransferase 1
MIYGSVCSGIEAASVAWHPLGWRAAWLAEIEAFPTAVLAHHFPDVPNLGDMTNLAKLVLTGKIAAPDVLVGGTPCQAFSVAGLREGLSDPRGQLTIKYVELFDAIDHVRVARGDDPAIAVWENVPGVLSDKSNAFGCFLGAISGEDCELQPPGGKWANAGCVFGPERAVAWRLFDAQFFGLAQRRRRVFVVASARAGFNPAQVLFEFGCLRRDTPPRRGKGPTVAALTANGVGTCGADDNQGQAGHLIPAAGCWWDGGQVSQTLDAVLAKGQTMPEKNRFPAVLQPIAFHPTQDPHVMHEMAVRRLTPTECERLQGFPDSWTNVPYRGKPAADGPRYKALGNSMAVPVMRWIGERIQMVCDHEKQGYEVAA